MFETLELAVYRYETAVHRIALRLIPWGQDTQARCDELLRLARLLYIIFERFGAISRLEEALTLKRKALELCPQGYHWKALLLSNMACSLNARFTRLGTLFDLEEAFTLERQALELHSQDSRVYSLGNLAYYHHTRFTRLGTLSDLHEAISLERQALELLPQDHSLRAFALGKIANYLWLRFNELGALSDLDEALDLERNALELRPRGHSERAGSLSKTAFYIHARFNARRNQLEDLSDLEEALTLERDALRLRRKGLAQRADSLSNIATYLHTRFKKRERLSDLDEAISYERDALELRPNGHPCRAVSLHNLTSYLYARFKQREKQDLADPDLRETFDLYSQLSMTDASQLVSFADVRCAKNWIQAAEECKHDTTYLAYKTFLHLSVHHLAAVPSLPHHLTILKKLMESTAVDAFSACLRYDKFTHAVELIEQGRGVFWSQLIRLRSSLDDVRVSGGKGEALAVKFTELASALCTMLDAPPGAQSQHDQACHYNTQLQNVIANIRELPGFSRFLQPTLFAHLREAAKDGPVVIVNASKYGCDALIVLRDRDPIRAVLPITKHRVSELSTKLRRLTSRAKVSDVARELLEFMRALWDEVVFPIVKIIQKYCPRGSRIWWCPTAEFSLLPLHAAGSFRKGQPTLSDLYVSSYTPTLAALIRARRPLDDQSSERPRFLIVGQAHAPGQSELASVNTEVSGISRRIGSSATLTCVQDQNAIIGRVSEELKSDKHAFVHFACHGIPDPKRPFEAGFALGDGRLKVEHVMQYDLEQARFSYLSACHTTVGDEESPDEVIHLAAAMQFAGFRSVIGTMWAVDDVHTNAITAEFYGQMMDELGRLDHTRAARALHDTMRRMRSSDVPIDQQILYIHIGA